METKWRYCRLAQDQHGKLHMFVLNDQQTQWVYGHAVKQLIDYEEERQVIVS